MQHQGAQRCAPRIRAAPAWCSLHRWRRRFVLASGDLKSKTIRKVANFRVASHGSHSLSSAMAGKRKRPSAQDEQANATEVVEDHHVLFTRIRLRYTTEREDAVSAILDMYQTCKTWRNELVDDGFCMRTFSLCRALADGNGPLTLQRVQSTIGRQLERKSDQVETDQAWWRPSYPAM